MRQLSGTNNRFVSFSEMQGVNGFPSGPVGLPGDLQLLSPQGSLTKDPRLFSSSLLNPQMSSIGGGGIFKQPSELDGLKMGLQNSSIGPGYLFKAPQHNFNISFNGVNFGMAFQ